MQFYCDAELRECSYFLQKKSLKILKDFVEQLHVKFLSFSTSVFLKLFNFNIFCGLENQKTNTKIKEVRDLFDLLRVASLKFLYTGSISVKWQDRVTSQKVRPWIGLRFNRDSPREEWPISSEVAERKRLSRRSARSFAFRSFTIAYRFSPSRQFSSHIFTRRTV